MAEYEKSGTGMAGVRVGGTPGVERGKSGTGMAGVRVGGTPGVERALNAFRLTLFGILLSIGLTAGLGFAALLGAWPGVAAGIVALVGTAFLLRYFKRPIATLMEWIIPGGP
jgi:hypothetical protein